jgi:hypothetical protein
VTKARGQVEKNVLDAATRCARNAWAGEQAAQMPLPAAFDDFIGLGKRVSPAFLISFKRNRYGVPPSLANRPVSLRIHPDRLVVAAVGNKLCEHARAIQRGQKLPPWTILDWRHHFAVAQRKPPLMVCRANHCRATDAP